MRTNQAPWGKQRASGHGDTELGAGHHACTERVAGCAVQNDVHASEETATTHGSPEANMDTVKARSGQCLKSTAASRREVNREPTTQPTRCSDDTHLPRPRNECPIGPHDVGCTQRRPSMTGAPTRHLRAGSVLQGTGGKAGTSNQAGRRTAERDAPSATTCMRRSSPRMHREAPQHPCRRDGTNWRTRSMHSTDSGTSARGELGAKKQAGAAE